jgi:predicted outer membrane protein
MRHALLLLLVVVPSALGCERGSDESGSMAADTISSIEDAAAVSALLAPIRAVSRAEIEYGDLAAQRAASEPIRQYGMTVAADHRAVLNALDSMAQSHGATLSETGDALDMANTVRMAHSGLENLTGPDFDLPFIRAEVESHRQLLDRLQQQAIPAASSEEVRNLLTDLRAMADAHLTRARQLLAQQLGESPDPRPAPGPPRPLGTPAPPPDTTGG